MKLFGQKRLEKSVSLLLLSIKSIDPIQKYPQITESYAFILKIFVCMFFGICSIPKLSKEVTLNRLPLE